NFEYFQEMAAAARGGGLLAHARVLLARPGWSARTGRVEQPSAVSREAFVKQAPPPASPAVRWWVSAQMGIVSLAMMALLMLETTLSRPVLVAAALLVMAATLAWAGILERRRWGWPLELARLGGSVALVL